MRDGAIICNTGHYDSEINIADLESVSTSHRTIRPNCEEYTLKSGNRVYLLAEGRLINLAAAEGHPSEVMDMSFANQFMSHLRMVEKHSQENGAQFPVHVIDMPKEQDEWIASVKLEAIGMKMDTLTPEQESYMSAYNEST